jgi:hypothetical protein
MNCTVQSGTSEAERTYWRILDAREPFCKAMADILELDTPTFVVKDGRIVDQIHSPWVVARLAEIQNLMDELYPFPKID